MTIKDIVFQKKGTIIVLDVAAISESIAEQSEWYRGVKCNTGMDGLKLANHYLVEIYDLYQIRSFERATVIMPIIGLADYEEMRKYIFRLFGNFEICQTREWPLPKEVGEAIDIMGDRLKFCYVKKKFGGSYTFTEIIKIEIGQHG